MAIINVGGGKGLEPLIEVLLNEKKLAQEKERIGLQKKDLEFRQEQEANDVAQAERDRQNQIAGAVGLLSLMNPQQQAVGAGLPQGALPGFVTGATELAESQASTRATTAGARAGESAARVAEATEGENIALKRQEVLQTFEATAGMSIQNALNQARLSQDPARVNTAWSLMQTGEMSAGQAFDAAGADLPPSITRDFKLNPLAAGSGAGGEAAAKASSLYSIMSAADSTMNTLVDQGVELGLMESWHRSSTNWLTSWTSGIFTDEDQRRLIQSQKQFADAYRFFISGQQSSDKEAERLLFTMLENPGDDGEVINQKRFMRRLTIGMAQQVAQGRIDPAQAAQNIFNAAVTSGLPEDMLSIFREQLLDAQIYTEAGGPSGGVVPASSGGTLGNVPGLILQGLGSDTIRPPGR